MEQLPKGISIPEGMVWIKGGKFHQGAVDHDAHAMKDEKPRHQVALDGFFMDIHPVTNSQYRKFVEAMDYVTVAEREVDWEGIKKQLSLNTPKPHDSILQPDSLVFKKTKSSVPDLYDYSQWWQWKIDTNWKHPNGPKSSIKGKENHPVVQIVYLDAVAYCDWAGTRLPTKAARGNNVQELSKNANTWEGEFPVTNTIKDGFELRPPVMTFLKIILVSMVCRECMGMDSRLV